MLVCNFVNESSCAMGSVICFSSLLLRELISLLRFLKLLDVQ